MLLQGSVRLIPAIDAVFVVDAVVAFVFIFVANTIVIKTHE